MKRLLKFGLIGIGGLLVVVVLVGYFYLGSIVKKAIETVGPQITQTELTVSSVGLLPFSGRGSIRGFFLGNPKGYKTEYAVKVEKVSINLVNRSLLRNTIIVQSVYVDSPAITYEGTLSNSNLKQIQRNVEAFAQKLPASGTSEKSNPAKKVIIQDLKIENAKVRLALFGSDTEISLPEIHMKNLGAESGGISPAQAVGKIFNELISGIVRSIQLDKVGASAQKAAQGVTSGIKSLLGK